MAQLSSATLKKGRLLTYMSMACALGTALQRWTRSMSHAQSMCAASLLPGLRRCVQLCLDGYVVKPSFIHSWVSMLWREVLWKGMEVSAFDTRNLPFSQQHACFTC